MGGGVFPRTGVRYKPPFLYVPGGLMPTNTPQPGDPRLRKFAWMLLGISAFMFVSIIVKTALEGP